MFIDILVSNFFLNLTINFPILVPIFEKITYFGSFQFIFYFYILLSCTFLILYFITDNKNFFYKYFLNFSASVLLSTGITYFLKIFFERVGPPGRVLYEIDYSFPSGHATAATSFFGILYFLFRNKLKEKWHKKIWGFFCAGMIFLVGLSRLVLNIHYLSDVLAGFLVGFLIIYCILKINDKYSQKNKK